MRVLFDVRYANFQRRRGIGIYANGLIDALARDSSLHLDLMIGRDHEGASQGRAITAESLRAAPDNHYDFFCMSSYFPDCWAGRADRLEIILPHDVVRTCKTVVGIGYDLIPLLFPDIYFKNNRPLQSLIELGASIAAKISCHTFAISQSTADDFVKLGICVRERLTVIGGGVDREEWTAGEFPSSTKTHVVYVGGDDPRKNLDGAVNGFAAFREIGGARSSVLTIAGNYSASSIAKIETIASRVGLKPGIDLIIPGELARSDLIALVQGARLSIFPSFYEGLALPILESYAAGTPVAASNTSSMRELVPPECQFDPHNPSSIGKAINSLFVKEEVRQASLAFGRQVLEAFTWRNAATKMVEALQRINSPLVLADAPKRIAVFSCMPPDESGIATDSCRVFKDSSKFDIFTDVFSRDERSARIASAQQSAGQPVGILPASAFRDAHELSPFAAAVFVLGNSHHNLAALDAAIQSRGLNLNRCAYLHDGCLHNLWFWYCKRNIDRLVQLFSATYNVGNDFENCRDHSDFLNLGYFGIRPLALLAGIDRFIVNSERAKRIVERELAPDLLARIDVAYLSIDPISASGAAPFERKSSSELIIGHFGIPDRNKGTNKLLEAAEILRKKSAVRVLLAGWRAKAYVEQNTSARERGNIIVIDSPSDEQLFLCMKSVDVAVQLRERSFGESSGIVAQLIGVGKRPIVSENLIDGDAEGRVVPVPNDIGPAQLAAVIANSIGHRSHNDDLSKFSSENLGRVIQRLALS